jgi:hypothetical protein
MASLLGNIKRPEVGDDPRELWRTVCDIMEVLENLTFTFVPSQPAVPVKISEGDVQIDLSNYISVTDAINRIPDYAAGSGHPDQAQGSGAFAGSTADGSE